METTIHQLKACRLLDWHIQEQAILLRIDRPTLIAAITGSVKADAGKRTLELTKDTLLFMRPGNQLKLYRMDKRLPKLCLLSFESYELVQQNEERLVYQNNRSSLPDSGWQSGKLPYRAIDIVKQLLQMEKQNGLYPKAASTIFDELLGLSIHSSQQLELVRDISLNAVISHINEHYATPLSREQLAKLSGFNTSYFSTLFTQSTGWGFSAYVNRVRIDRAKELLLSSSLTVQEIASKVGYTSGIYLSRKFKQITGLSPGQFRDHAAPMRIVAFQFAGCLLALGLTPVAMDAELSRDNRLLQPYLRNVPTVDGAYDGQPLTSLEAELVIAPTYYYNMPGRMNRLEQIAPILSLEWGKRDPISELLYMGKLLRREHEADMWVARYTGKVQMAKERLDSLLASGQTAAVYELRENGWYIWSNRARAAYNLYNALGFQAPAAIQRDVLDPDKHHFIALNELPAYAADHMFIITGGAGSDRQWKQLEKDMTVQRLPIGCKGKLYRLQLDDFWCCDGLLLELQLDIQVNHLLQGN
ncbi:helix-turn-helix domain-containing protein [Paenibacillus paeoniae]|uniref:Helix-turn-helix domain-containing protein n=1 Tax=Paenibacillus paeoniae TaxID=2292705 RepID=A0A371P5K1_9BACL|nr:helix-turn-helix domain-containing protein [Paenibacillus paeoniae]REK71224.1 helix-turn-helix domain-containing protein [Paenibacillus paeoniae]